MSRIWVLLSLLGSASSLSRDRSQVTLKTNKGDQQAAYPVLGSGFVGTAADYVQGGDGLSKEDCQQMCEDNKDCGVFCSSPQAPEEEWECLAYKGSLPASGRETTFTNNGNSASSFTCYTKPVVTTTVAATTVATTAAATTTTAAATTVATTAAANPCKCKKSWSRKDLVDKCGNDQAGCTNCDDDQQGSWCMVQDKNCDEAFDGGYAYCNVEASNLAQGWTVADGQCTVVDGCVQSPNYPKNYGSSQACAITINDSFWSDRSIVTEAFNTESGYDKLSINGEEFDGNGKGIDGKVPKGTMSWNSDIAVESSGWKLCPSKATTTTVAATTVATTAAAGASLTGDPHMQNVRGEKQDLLAPGTYNILELPSGRGDALTLIGDVSFIDHWKFCNPLFLTKLRIVGTALGDQEFNFDMGNSSDPQSFSVTHTNLRTKKSQFFQVSEPIKKQFGPVGLSTAQCKKGQVGENSKDCWDSFNTMALKLSGKDGKFLTLNVRRGGQLGFFDVKVNGLDALGMSVGGLLGTNGFTSLGTSTDKTCHNKRRSKLTALMESHRGDVHIEQSLLVAKM